MHSVSMFCFNTKTTEKALPAIREGGKEKMKKTGKNRHCPYRGHCSNECYGENPCDFALKFDRMQAKITRLEKRNSKLTQEVEATENHRNEEV